MTHTGTVAAEPVIDHRGSQESTVDKPRNDLRAFQKVRRKPVADHPRFYPLPQGFLCGRYRTPAGYARAGIKLTLTNEQQAAPGCYAGGLVRIQKPVRVRYRRSWGYVIYFKVNSRHLIHNGLRSEAQRKDCRTWPFALASNHCWNRLPSYSLPIPRQRSRGLCRSRHQSSGRALDVLSGPSGQGPQSP